MTDDEKVRAVESKAREIGMLLPWCPKCGAAVHQENRQIIGIVVPDAVAVCPNCGDIALRTNGKLDVWRWKYRL